MFFANELREARRVAELAMQLMQQHQAPPTPQNFLVWYTYADGSNTELACVIDTLISNHQDVTSEAMDELQERFFGGLASGGQVQGIGERLRAELETLTEMVGTAGTRTTAYGETLASASVQLARPIDAQRLKATLDGLMLATKSMEGHSRALEDRLKASSAEVSALKGRMEEVRKEALTDGLTGVANRKCFDQTLRAAAVEAMEGGQALCLVMGDIDHFKRFNDTWGHQTGDQVLRLVAHCMQENVKGRDTVARYGGEEFAVILPATALENARVVADQIRCAVEKRRIVRKARNETLGAITLSLGCAQLRPGEKLATLIARADACLYAAKRAGRNRVATESDPEAAAPDTEAAPEPKAALA